MLLGCLDSPICRPHTGAQHYATIIYFLRNAKVWAGPTQVRNPNFFLCHLWQSPLYNVYTLWSRTRLFSWQSAGPTQVHNLEDECVCVI